MVHRSALTIGDRHYETITGKNAQLADNQNFFFLSEVQGIEYKEEKVTVIIHLGSLREIDAILDSQLVQLVLSSQHNQLRILRVIKVVPAHIIAIDYELFGH